MTSQELIQTQIPNKINKLRYILNWASENCDDEQFDRFNEAINEYNDVLLYYPFHGTANVAHETDYIETNIPDKRDLLGTEQEQEHIREEIRKHKELVNELQARIYQLEELQE